MYSVVLDTNVIISALRSRQGASFAILRRIGQSWVPLISVPLILEYGAVAKREAENLKIPFNTVDTIVGRSDATVTHTVRHFRGADRVGIPVLTPREFLKTIG